VVDDRTMSIYPRLNFRLSWGNVGGDGAVFSMSIYTRPNFGLLVDPTLGETLLSATPIPCLGAQQRLHEVVLAEHAPALEFVVPHAPHPLLYRRTLRLKANLKGAHHSFSFKCWNQARATQVHPAPPSLAGRSWTQSPSPPTLRAEHALPATSSKFS